MTGDVSILGMAPGASLSGEQSRRVTCLAVALILLAGRQVQVPVIREVAEWLYRGGDDD